MQCLTRPVLLDGHFDTVACELHQMAAKPVHAQGFVSLLSQELVQGTEEDKASAETLFEAAFYSCGVMRVLYEVCDGSTEGLL